MRRTGPFGLLVWLFDNRVVKWPHGRVHGRQRRLLPIEIRGGSGEGGPLQHRPDRETYDDGFDGLCSLHDILWSGAVHQFCSAAGCGPNLLAFCFIGIPILMFHASQYLRIACRFLVTRYEGWLISGRTLGNLYQTNDRPSWYDLSRRPFNPSQQMNLRSARLLIIRSL